MKKSPSSLALISISLAAFSLTACDSNSGQSTAAAEASTPVAQNSSPQSTDADNSIALRPDRIPLVVGGSVVNHNRYPWMAALVSASEGDEVYGQFCGGSLIADRWVLTAAHCVEEETANSTDVLIGRRDLNDNGGTRIGASRIIIHPDYQARGYPDLALIELESSSNAPVITLPSRNNPAPEDGEIATVTGWGQVSENGPASEQLRETSLPVVDHDTCNRAYGGDIDQDSMVCAGTASGDKDSCYGDSGGPLFVKRNDSYIQAGVVSFGEECGLPGVPGVYARVSSYHDWISAYAPVDSYNADNFVPDANNSGNTEENTDDNVAQESTDDEDFTEDSNLEEDYFDEDADYEDYFDTGTGQDNEDYDFVETASDNFWSFNGKFDYSFEEIYLPNDSDSLSMDAGLLTLNLTTDSNEPVVVFIDQYDPEYDEWFTISGEISRRGEVYMELDIDAGEYGFSVLSLGEGGSFELDANLE